MVDIADIEEQGLRKIIPGMQFENNGFLGGFRYRVEEVLGGENFRVYVTPWGEAQRKNAEGEMTLTKIQIEAILRDHPEVSYG